MTLTYTVQVDKAKDKNREYVKQKETEQKFGS